MFGSIVIGSCMMSNPWHQLLLDILNCDALPRLQPAPKALVGPTAARRLSDPCDYVDLLVTMVMNVEVTLRCHHMLPESMRLAYEVEVKVSL